MDAVLTAQWMLISKGGGAMPRRGYSPTVGKFAKVHQDRRRSEIRVLSETMRAELALAYAEPGQAATRGWQAETDPEMQ